jgi:alkanesulfonate monooxygenase SsuD/methylene tetrahydromethanopterin reductase-like flavin-dependent oxidoreductase (luciferase family)
MVLEQVAKGAGGALPDDFTVVARLFCAVTDDVPGTREIVKATFAPYIATSVYNKLLPLAGLRGRRRRRARGARSAGPRGMAAAVSDELVDDLFCLGTADEVASKVADYCEAGVTVPALMPLAMGREQSAQTLWDIADAYNA